MNRLFLLPLAAICLTAPASAQIASVQHVIVVVQENRTPDNLFQGLCTAPTACSTQPGPGQYNIQTSAWLDKTSPTRTTPPHAVPLGVGYDLSHVQAAFRTMCDRKSGACAMDGAANVVCTNYGEACPAKAAFGYVDNSTGSVQPYLNLATAYGWGNYFFQTNQGASYTAHQYLFGATSAPSANDDHAGNFVSDSGTSPVGCAAAATASVPVVNAQGVVYTNVYPCFERQTLSDLLEAAGVSWRYYGVSPDTWPDAGPNGIWTAPNSIKHICNAAGSRCAGAEWTSHMKFTPSQVLSDISTNCNLAGVSWVTPDAADSDHARIVNNTGGPSWVASIVNAIGTSPCKNPDGSSYWGSTAIIVTWDDWGGWYDHVAPTIETSPQGGYQMGFRVPLIVVSAYTPAGFISNTPEDFGSVIRFVERNFGRTEGALTFADARSTGDLTEFFSLGQRPRPFQAIEAPLSARDFLTRQPSDLPVDDD
jgi:phospholipase C